MGQIRAAKISAIYPDRGTARVIYTDRDQAVSPELPFWSEEIYPYRVDDLVWVATLDSGRGEAVILGMPHNQRERPREAGEELFRRDFSRSGKAYLRWNEAEGVLEISVTGNVKIVASGECSITAPSGDVQVNGVSLVGHTHDCPDGKTSAPNK